MRAKGLLAAVEIVADKATKRKPSPELRLSERLFDQGYRNGVVFRAFADGTIGLAPPLCITEGEVDSSNALARRLIPSSNSRRYTHETDGFQGTDLRLLER